MHASRFLSLQVPGFALRVAGACLWAMPPPLLALPRISPSEVIEVDVWCEDSHNRNRRVPNCRLSVQTSARARSNGHFHTGGGQPVSKLGESRGGPFASSLIVNTGSSGLKTVWFKAHLIGQYEDLISCSYAQCTYLTYYVGCDDLSFVPENDLRFHVGGNTTGHGDNYYNHWTTSRAREKLAQAVESFNDDNSRQARIAVNDMSLPRGGTFDIDQNWRPPHRSHSRGTAVDVRGNGGCGSIPVGLLREFVDSCNEAGASYAAIEGSGAQRHMHCNW